ncbi:MAG TPA: metalloregulator ArsR/SmtB family transcription factor [Chloroflexota bacterium]|jgi:DNA-binding transcriptional ArsR family regulator|nr:metalloregulator ArsR/SmtB family transcription factor [Chloroflexota bacterium]
MKTEQASPGDVFQAIADPTRRGLLEMVAGGERPVKALAESFQMTRPAVSQHLRVLRDAGLVTERRVGRERRYRLRAGPLREVRDWVRQYDKFWQERLAALGEHLEDEA